MYDITNRNTFTSVAGWMDSVSEHASPNITMVLVGHKCDLDDERDVEIQEGQKVWNKSPWALTTFVYDTIFHLFNSWQSTMNACSSSPAPKLEPTVAR